MIKSLLLAAFSAAFFLASPAHAYTQHDIDATGHNRLIKVLSNHGITSYLDADVCETQGLSGFYHSPTRSLVLCNKGSKQMSRENLDTLRHESIHVAQDCRAGKLGDKRMGTVFPFGYVENAAQLYNIDLDNINHIYTVRRGASAEVVRLEYEAFAGAAALTADEVSELVKRWCPIVK